jgi:hypothetical protein
MISFPLELNGIEPDYGAVNMKEVITINKEMHFQKWNDKFQRSIVKLNPTGNLNPSVP